MLAACGRLVLQRSPGGRGRRPFLTGESITGRAANATGKRKQNLKSFHKHNSERNESL